MIVLLIVKEVIIVNIRSAIRLASTKLEPF